MPAITYGLLVYGANHFIVDGPQPSPEIARALIREWAHPMPLRPPDPRLTQWSIRTRAFREHLAWAIIVPSEEPHTTAVTQLLAELRARGQAIHSI